ncbi:leucyl aminopeptidase [Alkalihalobacterium alkalinitrilicum]|uniref:leucyl aminopeptidase n=1 Tax=Alkalihalobacterium alkalinitrilicum TaxID=427920 RepID=UPI000995672E|nr:leucyl aminopeptidase [Alkalihalobacterium alkalinitrilicum]
MYNVVELKNWKNEEVDGIFIALFEDDKHWPESLNEVDASIDGTLKQMLKEARFHGKFKSVFSFHTLGKLKAKKVYIVGVGKRSEIDDEQIRSAFATLSKKIHADQLQSVAVILDSFVHEENEEHYGYLLSEAIELTSYKVAHYKEKDNQVEKSLERVTIFTNGSEQPLLEELHAGKVYGGGTNLARALVNTPGNLLTPTDLAESAKEIAERHGMEIDILEREDMEKLGMGALLAVAQGSEQPPKMIVMKYQGKKEWNDVLAFVGKGLTFDSGGISIKPGANMHEMKMDMGGAAAVLGAMDIIGQMKPETNVLAVIPSSENLLNGLAMKPGDVITSLSGKTIEVRNTDAEGRLILADGVTYAKHLGASYLVDVATLTGAVIIALGEYTTGAVTNNEELMEKLLYSAYDSGEWVWRLPSFEPYRKMLQTSDVADLNNSPGRPGGSITAGLFIGEFAGDTPWVHLDIAGTAWSSKGTETGPKGGTGAMARTLATLAEQFDK